MNKFKTVSTETLKNSVCYVKSVLRGNTSSCVCDGDLEAPAGGRCTTRSGFKSWLKRAEKELATRQAV